MRRYIRNIDPYQDEEKLLTMAQRMIIAIFPDGKPFSEFKKLLFSIQHNERKPDKKSKSGRKSRYEETFLIDAAYKIKVILQNETGGRISLLRFISTYLPLLSYPQDIRTALNKHLITLSEAKELAKINSSNLGTQYKSKPSQIRADLLDSHLKKQDTQKELASRVHEKIYSTPKAQAKNVTNNIIVLTDRNDEFLELTEYDTDHLLWEEIKGLVYQARETDLTLFKPEQIDEILNNIDELKIKLNKWGKPQKQQRIVKY